MSIALQRSRSPRPARRPLPPLAGRPPDYRMSDNHLDQSVRPLAEVLGTIHPVKYGGMSVHVYGGFIIHHQRLPHQPAQVRVYHSDDGYAHCKPVEFCKLPTQTLRDLVTTMTGLQLTPVEIALATGFRLVTIKAYLANEQPD